MASFEPTTARQARRIIQSWADDPEPQPAQIQDRLIRQVYPALETAVLYQLSDLRATAEHDWGWVVGHCGFHEFVAIDGDNTSTLTLIVASDD